jgi:hypothetical protein
MGVFGIGEGTAMRYLYTAHPERRSTLPKYTAEVARESGGSA